MTSFPSSFAVGSRQPLFGSFDFPVELFEKILLNLDAEDFLAASLVSKTWNRAMRDSGALRANFDMKLFMKSGGPRIVSIISQCVSWNSGNVGAIRPLIDRLQRQMNEADDNLTNDTAVRKIRRSNFDLFQHPDAALLLTPDILTHLETTSTLFKDVDFENQLFAYGPLTAIPGSVAIVVRLDSMRPMAVVRERALRISCVQIYSSWIFLGIDSPLRLLEKTWGSRYIQSRGVGCRYSRGTEIWNWTGSQPRKILSLPYSDVRLFPSLTSSSSSSTLVGLTPDRTSLSAWRFQGDATKSSPTFSIRAFPFNAKTHAWEDFNVDGRNLIAAKKSLICEQASRALSVHVFDVATGNLLWTISGLPCRSLEIRHVGIERPSVFLCSFLAEVDVSQGRRNGVVVIDTRAARKKYLEAAALRRRDGAILTYDEQDAARNASKHVRIRTKSPFNRVNEHGGNPWMIARWDHFESGRGYHSNAEYRTTHADTVLKAMSSEKKVVVGYFCVFKAERDENNDWIFQLKDFFPD